MATQIDSNNWKRNGSGNFTTSAVEPTMTKHSILSNGDSSPSVNKDAALGFGKASGLVTADDAKMPPITTTMDTELGRGNWSNQLEFVMACVGYAVGLGNIWRFPYLVFRNGGGAFLIPYLLMVLAIGLPIFFSEMFIGQYAGLGPIKAYTNMAPIFQGLGFCTLVVITFVTIYYMVIIAWIIFYLFASFWPRLLWGYCNNEFNTDNCYSSLEDNICKANNQHNEMDNIFWKRTCTSVKDICESNNLIGINATYCFNVTAQAEVPVRQIIKRVLASEEYYYQNVLAVGDSSWSNWGYPRWQLVLCLLLGWVIAFLCLIKGVKSAGKVIYFTALFPYVILTALLIRGVTLEGAREGILFYVNPKWETLAKASVWGDAASQIFYSFGLACGSLVAFASYSQFNNNCHRDTIFVSITNVFTCIYAGFPVFAFLGFMAKNIDVPVDEVVQSGPGLAFIAYPEAVLMMPLPHVWSVAFFLMMFTLGMGSQFGGIEAICTSLIDQWPHLRDHHWRVTAGVCIACFVAGIPMVCNGGIYLFTLMEWHTASWAILLLGLAEVVIISWIYGMEKAFDNMLEMGISLCSAIRFYWSLVWKIITPIASFAVFVFILYDIKPTSFNGYKFPVWADLLGWLMGACTLIPFPAFVIYRLYKDGWDKEALFSATKDWKPQGSQTEKLPLELDEKIAAEEKGVSNTGFVDA
ncbi:sodium- and chloride-dependent glycine transporter 1-like isoform X1 [Episyrphus balteatus]|uniref:sodium- and chloride-dependent glycine transporter 1-like isoform X1 n=2 Tax=Episyrphus balteatus TaxID=286459 RepID=UPI002485B6AE|nr:sodium- and chloride-dependent glycine transporter 1-like isoform X1 [Episyrphus balteatus]